MVSVRLASGVFRVLILIQNTPRAYAWGSREALPELLGLQPNGEPQAELWLGAHPGDPASVAKGGGNASGDAAMDLIELITSDPERYGVDGGQLPFLLKVLAIGAPLSLQVHPNKQQAEEGFAREQAAGVPLGDRSRTYGDPNHKPELLVALGEVKALSGFRPLADATRDVQALVRASEHASQLAELSGAARDGLRRFAELCADATGAVGAEGAAAEDARTRLLEWALSGGDEARAVALAIGALVQPERHGDIDLDPLRLDPLRLWSLQRLTEAHPGDPGVLISLLLHLELLQPGEAIYLGAQQLHAYLDGLAVEVMASSDNVLRAGFTEKHVDVAEVLRIVDPAELDTPRITGRVLRPGLVAWQPEVPDFSLMRARVGEGDADGEAGGDADRDSDRNSVGVVATAGERTLGASLDVFDGSGNTDPWGDSDPWGSTDARWADGHQSPGNGQRWGGGGRNQDTRAESVTVDTTYPLVMIVTEGRVRVDRVDDGLAEFAVVSRGQSLYISAGEPIELSGVGETFIATVGDTWPRVSQPSSAG